MSSHTGILAGIISGLPSAEHTNQIIYAKFASIPDILGQIMRYCFR